MNLAKIARCYIPRMYIYSYYTYINCMVSKEVFEMKNLSCCKTMRDIKSLKSDLKSELNYFRLSISNIESLKE